MKFSFVHTYKYISICYACTITTLLLLISIGAAVINSPPEVIYRLGDDPVELSCTVTEGSIAWSVNGGDPVTVTTIRNGNLDNHTVNGTNLVVLIPTNNTRYVCVAVRDEGDLSSNPVYLYIVGMYVCVLEHYSNAYFAEQ